MGFWKTKNQIRRQFVWKGMNKDIAKYIKSCVKCQRNKSSKRTMMPMVLTDTPCRPFEKVYMDMVGPLPVSSSGNRFILTFQDDFSKYMTCAAMPDGEASTVARVFFDEVIAKFGVPSKLVTDNGSNFISKVFADTCKLLGIRKLTTTLYHPQANGSLERSHRPMAEYFRSFVDEDCTNWDQWLSSAMHVHNNSIHSATGQTPFKTLYGSKIDLITTLNMKCKHLYNMADLARGLGFKQQRSHETQERVELCSKEAYDKNTQPDSFTVGDKVLLWDNARDNKFSSIWRGPNEAIAVEGHVNTTIRIKGKKCA